MESWELQNILMMRRVKSEKLQSEIHYYKFIKGEVFSKISGISLSAEKFKNDEKKK